MSTIRYFLPEDGDTEQHPNVFLAPKPRHTNQPPLLGDIKSSFPLKGNYHFRFKSSLIPGGETFGKGNDMAVWMDCVDNTKPVPYWRNSIIAKVTRIQMDVEEYHYEEPQQTYSNGVHHNQAHVAPPPSVSTPNPQPVPPPDTENLLNVFDHPTPVAAPTPPSNLFDMDHPSTHTSSSTGSLLDMDAPPTAHPVTSNPHSDLLGMSMPSTVHHHHPQQHPETPHTQASPQQSQPYIPNQSVNIPAGVPVTGGMPQRMSAPKSNNRSKINGFDSFAEKQGPFGNLNWS